MYGTVARIKPNVGKEKMVATMVDEWETTRGAKVNGGVTGYLYKLDSKPGELIMVAVFQDKKSYTANAQGPEQDKWFRRMRDPLSAGPV